MQSHWRALNYRAATWSIPLEASQNTTAPSTANSRILRPSVVPTASAGCCQDQAQALFPPPFLEGPPRNMARNVGAIEVIEPGAAEVAVGDVEAGRLDDVDRHGEAGGEAQHGAGVLRNVRLVKSKSRHEGS